MPLIEPRSPVREGGVFHMIKLIESFKIEARALGVDENSIEEFTHWVESSMIKSAWIEPLKSDPSHDESWIMKEHPELMQGRHPLYAFSDDEFKANGIILVGSVPITKNFIKNFKLSFADKYEEQEEQEEQGE
jgi:hypothetical protein